MKKRIVLFAALSVASFPLCAEVIYPEAGEATAATRRNLTLDNCVKVGNCRVDGKDELIIDNGDDTTAQRVDVCERFL